jgi:hypothetical protein
MLGYLMTDLSKSIMTGLSNDNAQPSSSPGYRAGEPVIRAAANCH